MEVRQPASGAHVGQILFQPFNSDFEIIVAKSPAPEQMICYGVYNKITRIVEAYTNSFAKAKYLCIEFQKDLTQGYDRQQVLPLPAGWHLADSGTDNGGGSAPPKMNS